MERNKEMSQLDNTLPVTSVSLSHIREQLRIAEIDIAESTMRRDALRLILDLREVQELNRTRAIIEKIYP
jgi:hypothetical protein